MVDRAGVSADVVRRMRDAMVSRGPDDAGLYADPRGVAALGHRRLSIIDLSEAGRQPLANEDSTAHVVVNGEFYGYRAVRDRLVAGGHSFASASDSEVAVHLYEDEGEGFAASLPGMFALALWDEHRSRLILARDRVGKKPLYYALTGTGIAFASHLGALMSSGAVDREIDGAALEHYFALGYVPGEMTIHARARKLLPAHALVFDAETGSCRTGRYWDLPKALLDGVTREEAAERTHALLASAVRERLVADVPVGVFLSGGLDSSLVAALAAEATSGPVRTFTIGFGEASHDERPYAARVAAHIGSRHEELVVEEDMTGLADCLASQYGEPFADSSAIPTYCVSRLTREHVTVALSGDGGDELFGGYNWYAWVMEGLSAKGRLGPLAGAASAVGRALPAGTRGKHYLERLTLDAAEQYAERTFIASAEERRRLLRAEPEADAPSPEEWVTRRFAEVPEGAGVVGAMTRADLLRYLVDDVLVKVDRASMAVALEVRCPLLDSALVEYAFSLPDELRFDGRVRKRVLRDVAKTLLPADLDLDRKHGFSVPLASWMRGALGDEVLEAVGSSETAQDHVRATRVAEMVEEHRAGSHDHSSRLWAVLAFAKWAGARA